MSFILPVWSVCLSELIMIELTCLQDSDLAIALWAIYTPFLSGAIDAGVTQSAKGVGVSYKCVLSLCETRQAELWVTARVTA